MERIIKKKSIVMFLVTFAMVFFIAPRIGMAQVRAAGTEYTDGDFTYVFDSENPNYVWVKSWTNPTGEPAEVEVPMICSDPDDEYTNHDVVGICKDAFKNQNVVSVIIGGYISTIGEGAFSENPIRSVTIPSNVQYIKENAFKDCEGMECAFFDAGYVDIGEGAFDSTVKIYAENGSDVQTYAAQNGNTFSSDNKVIRRINISVSDYTFPKYGDKVVNPTFTISSTDPYEAADTLSLDTYCGWYDDFPYGSHYYDDDKFIEGKGNSLKVMLIPKNYPAKYSFNGTLVYFNGKLVDKYDWSDPYYFIAGKLFDIDNPGFVYLYQTSNDKKGSGKVCFDGTEWKSDIGEYYASGKTITIHAMPNEESVFIGWKKSGEDSFASTDPDYTITTPDSDVTDQYYAYFERKFPATGTVNSSVDYTFDSATGTMTFIPTKDDGEGHKTGSLTGFSYYSSSTDRSPIFCTSKVKHIVIEEGITEIGSYFVYESKNVEDISIPATVVGISSDAFSGSKIGEFIVASESELFTTLNGSLFSKDKNTMIRYASTIDGLDFIVPDGVTVIQRDCFEKADFNTVTLKGEGLCLEDYALRCSYKHLIISEGVKELGDYSSTPSEDTVITLPASLRYVGNQGIINSEKCTEIKVAEGNETYKSIDGVLYVINSDETLSLHKYPVGKTETSFTTPKQVKKIGWCAIRSQKYLKDITITENVEKIDGGAMEYLEDATVTIQNPDCEIALDAFEFNTNLTLKGLKGSTAFTYANEHGISFICTGEDLGKLSAPTNIRWEGTKVKWDPIENARYNVKFYRNESGSWDHVTSEDKVIADGSCEIDYKTLMWYKDAGYKMVISASKVGYDDSDEVESSVASGLFNRGNFDAQIDGDTILAPFDIGDNTDFSWFSYYVIFYDESDTVKYSSWVHIDSKDEYPNLREILASKDAPYGKYKVYVSKNIEYYGWTVGIASSNDKVEYNYQSIPKVIKVELDIPDPVHGAQASLTSGLKVKTYCGENVLDALGKSTQYYENCYQYKYDDSSSWTGFGSSYDAKVIKGMYQYAYYLILKARKGYEISEDIQLYINGESSKDRIIEKSSSLIKLRYEFPVGTKAYEYIDTATVTGDYDKPMIGKDIKDPENVQVEEGLSVEEAYWITKEGSEWKTEKVTGKFEAGKDYAIYVGLKADEDNDYRFANVIGSISVFGDSEAICNHLSLLSSSFIKVVGEPEAEPTPTPSSEPTTSPTAGPDATPTPGTEATPTPGTEVTPTATPAAEKVKAPGKVSIKKPKNKKGRKLYVKWAKKKDVAGYEVQYSLKRSFSKAKKAKTKLKSTTKTSITIKKLKKKKTYYVRVRAYKLDSAGNKVYGNWSKVKKIKIKK